MTSRNLRAPLKAHLFDASAGLCSLVWQGDFGAGVPTSSGIYEAGISPYTLYGPVVAGASGVIGGIPQIPFRLGTVVQGDLDTEFVLCRWVPAATTDLVPGLAFILDENYTATLSLTSGIVLNAPVAFGMVMKPAVLAGTYYIWLARAGRLAVRAAASSIATGMGETSATAGVLKFLNSHTGSTATVGPCSAFAASSNITFKADTVNGSPIIQNLASQISINGVVGGITDLVPGMVITGTGMPSNAIIAFIDQKGPGGTYRAGIGTNTTGNQLVAQNATATNLQTTLTVTSHVQALVYWPTLTTQN